MCQPFFFRALLLRKSNQRQFHAHQADSKHGFRVTCMVFFSPYTIRIRFLYESTMASSLPLSHPLGSFPTDEPTQFHRNGLTTKITNKKKACKKCIILTAQKVGLRTKQSSWIMFWGTYCYFQLRRRLGIMIWNNLWSLENEQAWEGSKVMQHA